MTTPCGQGGGGGTGEKWTAEDRGGGGKKIGQKCVQYAIWPLRLMEFCSKLATILRYYYYFVDLTSNDPIYQMFIFFLI